LDIARSTGLPFRLLEIGCSAGLNLRWDRYCYETACGEWGPAGAPVVFENSFSGNALPLDVAVDVLERRGCDLNPIDPTTKEGRLRLLSFVWPDQTARFRQLSNAIEVARTCHFHNYLAWIVNIIWHSWSSSLTAGTGREVC
jgi:hypothetical protein